MVIPAYQEIILPAVLLWSLGLVYPGYEPMYAWYVRNATHFPKTIDLVAKGLLYIPYDRKLKMHVDNAKKIYVTQNSPKFSKS